MATLKPCPKCGKRKYAFVNDYDGWIFCRACGYSTEVYETIHEAIEAWNNGSVKLEEQKENETD